MKGERKPIWPQPERTTFQKLSFFRVKTDKYTVKETEVPRSILKDAFISNSLIQ